MFGRGRGLTTLPTKSPHLPSSGTFKSLLSPSKLPPPLVALARRHRVALSWVAAALAVLFLVLSSHSPFARVYPSSTPNFPSKGLKKELWTYLNALPYRNLHLQVSEVPWSIQTSPEQPVPWVHTDLFSLPTTYPNADGDAAAPSRPAVPTHELDVYPRKVVLPRTAPRLDKLMFGIVTTVDRAKMMSVIWGRWLQPPNEPLDAGRPACLILVSAEEREDEVVQLRQLLLERGLQCEVKMSQHDRYEVRVLSMTVEMRDYGATLARSFDWYVFNDDDTFWLDQRTLRRLMAKYDPRDDWYIGATSEAKNQLESFGRMAFGGAGILVSDTLMLKIYNLWDTCWANWKHIFGGDEMITRCAALALGRTKQTVTTYEPSMHQFDIPGDTTGVFQSGLPFLNLHHYIGGSWVHIFGYGSYRSDLSQIQLLKQVLDFIGGDNMFKRYVFGDGKWLLTQGYSLTAFEVPLKPQQLSKVEHTWYSEYRLTLHDRPVVPERHEWDGSAVKQTFYIDGIKTLSPTSAVLTYVMADKWDEQLSSAERVRIDVLWETISPPGTGRVLEPSDEADAEDDDPSDKRR